MSDIIIQSLINPNQNSVFLLFKYLFLSASFGFLIFSVVIFFTTKWFRLYFWYDFVEFLTQKVYGGVWAGIKWKFLARAARKAKDEDFCSYTIKGHDIMDKILMRLVPLYQSNSYGERLARCAIGTFTNPDDLWWAHELYRAVKAGSISRINKDDFDKLINIYQKAFEDLEVA